MTPRKHDPGRDDIINSAVAILVGQFLILPVDSRRIVAFFTDVVNAAIESAILLDRQRWLMPSDN
jgi:hypothetical protein